jgi:tripartite-type tricarboxylate transporter receptor subunit TctC
MKRTRAVLFGLGVALFAAVTASAQDAYPSKVVKIVVPFSAGGSTDLLARNLAERLGESWKQAVIVDNRAGAGGVIGADALAKSKPDGYTLLLGTVTTHAVAQTLYPKLPYNIQRDFVPITELVTIPQLLSVHPSLPVSSLQELVAYAKSKPGEIAYNGSVGTTPHMSMELLAARAGIKMLPIPYRGSGPAMTDLVAGQLQASFDVVMTTLPYMQAGKLRVLAVTSARRSPLLPKIPTIAESGYPGYESDVWFGLFAPAGTPPHIVNRISADVRTALTEPKMRQKLEATGFSIVASSPNEFAVRVKDDIQKWRKVIIDANIKAE